MGKEQKEFIVTYSPSFSVITAADYGERGIEAVLEYQNCALFHCKGSKYGDVVPWNNAFWCSVMAKNAKEALDIFGEKMKRRKLKHEPTV